LIPAFQFREFSGQFHNFVKECTVLLRQEASLLVLIFYISQGSVFWSLCTKYLNMYVHELENKGGEKATW
jgi:hypothetical protein